MQSSGIDCQETAVGAATREGQRSRSDFDETSASADDAGHRRAGGIANRQRRALDLDECPRDRRQRIESHRGPRCDRQRMRTRQTDRFVIRARIHNDLPAGRRRG